MRNSTLLLAIASAMFMQAAPAAAQNNVPIRKIKAVKPSTELTLLDRVESDTHWKIYQYNEYGYITSVMEYNKEAEQWVLDTDNSYRQEYVFNAAGQCTARTSFNVDKAGNKTTEKNKANVEVIGNTTWERYYKEYPDGTTHISEAYAYDQWGNRVEEIRYGYDSYSHKEYIIRYNKREYSGPVDIYTDNANYESLKNGRLLYYLRARGYDDQIAMNTNELYVEEFRKTVWQTENDKLYRREYVCRGSMALKVGSIEKKMWKSSESEFTLNADGTRPIKETIRSYDETGEVMRDYTYHTYTWDDRGRLLASFEYNESLSEVSYKNEYTYADDYAKTLSLREAIAELSCGNQIYPEDEFLQFGRIATSSFWYDDGDNGKSTYEWNADGQLTGGKWSETCITSEPDTDNPTTRTDYGEVRVGYNADGHMAWEIDHSISENDFTKIEYLYNKEGIWTGEAEYSGDGWDGPWTKENEWGNAKARKRLATRAATTPKFIDDLTDGSHSIRNSDGVWNTNGGYDVSDGVVTYGRYEQTLVSNASVPANPAYNYTDPLLPLEGEDEEEAYPVTSEAIWYYYWNTDKGDWELKWGPTEAQRVYNKDGNIVADTYNGNQTIVSTITYRLDDDDRLIEETYSKGGNITYEYLPGTDYLLESVETAADGYHNVCHYYYSKHNYVDPTGIESIKRNDASTPVWYDLQGRRITTPTSKGIYIVNGKKVVVR